MFDQLKLDYDLAALEPYAYYLRYRNLRASYLENLWNVINWDVVGKMYE